jgi:hypothetical protein
MKLYTFLFLICLLWVSCAKEENNEIPEHYGNCNTLDQLPQINTSGTNSFGLILNDVVWVQKGFRFKAYSFFSTIENELEGWYKPTSGEFLLTAYKSCRDKDLYPVAEESFNIRVKNGLFNEGTISTSDEDHISLSFFDSFNKKYYGSDDSNPGQIEILRLDTFQQIISGTFSGVLYNNELIDSVVVSEGRFDFSY